MVTAALLLLGAMLLALTLADRRVRRWPVTPSVLYLAAGWWAGALLDSPLADTLDRHLPSVTLLTELAVLLSLMGVGLRLRWRPGAARWRLALLLAGPGMVLTVGFGTVAAALVLGLPWPAAWLLAAVLAPTDPVLASEVQMRSGEDRDAVRLALTAEGGLNDGSALPAVMLGLGLMGLHSLGPRGTQWLWADLLWPVGGGVLVGALLGRGLGALLAWRERRGEGIARDELLYVGTVLLGFGIARGLHLSSFVVVFVASALLLHRAADPAPALAGTGLAERLHGFGARVERLVEAATVLAVGAALQGVSLTRETLFFGLLMLLLVRPLAVAAITAPGLLGPHPLAAPQRRLLAWFGIRGVGTLYYLAFALTQGVPDALAEPLVSAALTAIALSILVHGFSSTPLMARYQRWQGKRLR